MNRMTRKKKSGFLTFCFSFLPGAGEMYLGFMKMGASLMGMFFALIGVAYALNLPVLFFGIIVEWFYSFFHVHNLAGLTDEEFLSIEDGSAWMLFSVRTGKRWKNTGKPLPSFWWWSVSCFYGTV